MDLPWKQTPELEHEHLFTCVIERESPVIPPLTLKLPATLMQDLAEEAAAQGCSIETLVISYICVALGEARAVPDPNDATSPRDAERDWLPTPPAATPMPTLSSAELGALFGIETEPENKLGLGEFAEAPAAEAAPPAPKDDDPIALQELNIAYVADRKRNEREGKRP